MKEFSRYTNREIATLGILKLVPEVSHPWVTDVGSFLKLQLTNQEMDVCIEEEMSQDLEKGFLALGKI